MTATDSEFSRLIASAETLGDVAQRSDVEDIQVLLRIEPDAAKTENGKDAFVAAFLMLARMTTKLTVQVPASPDLSSKIRKIGARITTREIRFSEESEIACEPFGAILSVGGEVRAQLPWTTINSDGWLVRIGAMRENIPFTATHPNPIGALAAASLGTTEIFKRMFRVKDARGPIHQFLSFSFHDYCVSESPGPALPPELNIEGLVQVGAGAIGNGIEFLLQRLPSRGDWSIVDRQDFEKENLGTCILIGPGDLEKAKAPLLAERVRGAKGFKMDIVEFLSQIVGKEVRYPRIIINGLDNVDARRAVQQLWPDLAIDGAIGTFSSEVTLHPWGPDLSCLMCDFDHPVEDSAIRNSKLTGINANKLRNLMDVVKEEDIANAPEGKRPWLRQRFGKKYCSILTPEELASVSDIKELSFDPSTPFVACLSSCMVLTELVRYVSASPQILESGFQFDVLIGPQNGIRKAHGRKKTCFCVIRKETIDTVRRTRAFKL